VARLPYADLTAADAKPVVDRIVAQRGSVLHLYQMLLHSAPLAEGWLALLTAIRQRCSLSGALRELVIMRVAILNGAQYEADQHVPFALDEGLSKAQLDALADWPSFGGYTPEQRAVLALTDSMTRGIQVPATVFDDARKHLNNRELVELVATIAAYNMVSRFIEALQIHSHDDRDAA
jgi:alkylhydroperoxidase family enzyme